MLIAVDGVVVMVWALVALVVWARVSVNEMVVGAVFQLAILDRVVGGRRRSWVTSLWAVVAVCGCWNLAVVVVCRARVVFVYVVRRRRGPCLLCEKK